MLGPEKGATRGEENKSLRRAGREREDAERIETNQEVGDSKQLRMQVRVREYNRFCSADVPIQTWVHTKPK